MHYGRKYKEGSCVKANRTQDEENK